MIEEATPRWNFGFCRWIWWFLLLAGLYLELPEEQEKLSSKPSMDLVMLQLYVLMSNTVASVQQNSGGYTDYFDFVFFSYGSSGSS